MRSIYRSAVALLVISLVATILATAATARDVARPEEIVSMRQVVYDTDTYAKLARMWHDYYEAYPSEYAYANWMYAARYASDEAYLDLLDDGLSKYQANPILLYLKALQYCGNVHESDGIKYLQRAVELDPGYTDPWFVLVTYYQETGEREQYLSSLRKLLESGAISDEVMDFNHNVLLGLEPNAILITNGDNDTYPAWILTELLGVRADVDVINRSLLNTDWYPSYVIAEGAPRFIGPDELARLRDEIKIKLDQAGSPGGPYGDTLIKRIITSAERAGRPVYFAQTLYTTEPLKAIMSSGRDLGLAKLVSRSNQSFGGQLEAAYSLWTDGFRTGGLDSWRLRNSSEHDAGRRLAVNYAYALAGDLEAIKEHAPQLRAELFNWYRDHVEEVASEKVRHRVAAAWCAYADDLAEVKDWCRQQGL